jgi:GTP-binding protein EngB required for normal cell division
LSKSDKLSQSEASKILREVKQAVEGQATVQLFSATSHRGVDEARKVLDAMLKL